MLGTTIVDDVAKIGCHECELLIYQLFCVRNQHNFLSNFEISSYLGVNTNEIFWNRV